MTGNLIIVSAPSGAGKTTIVAEVLRTVNSVRPSISYTSRSPRTGEEHGRHYHFVSKEEFGVMVDGGEFLEWAEVHGNLYGTARKAVYELLESGTDVIVTIDVQGAANARRAFPDAVSVFIMPPSYETLIDRLNIRGANSTEDFKLRVRNAQYEIEQFRFFDYVIINDDLTHAVNELTAIIIAARCRRQQRTKQAESILQTFGRTVSNG